MDSPHLARIVVYPVKSLDGVQVTEAEVTARGGLGHDRRFAMRDTAGRIVNGKRVAAVHGIRARWDLAAEEVEVWSHGNADGAVRFHLDRDRDALAGWLSKVLDIELELDEDPDGGFPDDTDASGPTLVSEASLDAVHGWFPDCDRDELLRRFRPNLVIGGVPAFWEDGLLLADKGGGRTVSIGAVELTGAKPCARCVVPTRDPDGGDADPAFSKRFTTERERALPDAAPRSRFDHFWRFAINTRVSDEQAGRWIRVGDAVR